LAQDQISMKRKPTDVPNGFDSLQGLLHDYGRSYWSRMPADDLSHVASTFGSGSRPLYMGSFYSGWDAYAMGTAKVLEAGGLPPATYFHACEVVPETRAFLLAHPAATRPQHIFADHTEYVCESLIRTAKMVVRNHEADVQEMLAAGWTRDCVQDKVETAMLLDLQGLFADAVLRDRSHCFLCGDECSTWAVPSTANAMVGIVAGTCCYDHSLFNKLRTQRANVVSDTIIPWAVFAFCMSRRQPDFIVEECVPNSAVIVKGMKLFLGQHYDEKSFFLEPCMFSHPQTGMRRFTVYRNMATLFWRMGIPDPHLSFGLHTVTDMHIYFAAAADEVEVALRALRVKRGFHAENASATWMQTLTPCKYGHLYDAVRDLLPTLPDQNVVYHVDQSGTWGLVRGPLARRLLRRSHPYSLLLKRDQLASEVLMQMGMPTQEEPWRSFLQTCNTGVARSVAGNGMHPAVYAAVFLSVLMSAI
jgi:hypothetical protein